VEPLDRYVEESRARRPLPLAPRERLAFRSVALFYLAATLAGALLLPWNRDFDPLLALALLALHTLLASVTFEIGRGFATADQLATVAIVYLMPLPLVAPLVMLGYLLSDLPPVLRRRVHPDRLWQVPGNADAALAAAAAVALVGPDVRGTEAVAVLAAAFVAQCAALALTSMVIYRIGYGTPVRAAVRAVAYVIWVDTLLWPFAALLAVGADHFAPALLAPVPLAWLLHVFARERAERYGAAVELNRAYRGTVMVLTDVVEAGDSYTAEHSRSVVALAEAVADELGVPADGRQELEFAALLHDVGKLAIPREILDKPAALTPAEFELIKTHTLEGERMLARVGGLLARVGRIVRSCHERWDGAGYPDGLREEEIPLEARIVFCCDAYNAMTTDRPYRRSIGRDAALREIGINAGTQFDPRIAAALRAVVLRDEIGPDVHSADAVRAVLAGTRAR
jgi:putative nucleotidyltransferase with HDIG domain